MCQSSFYCFILMARDFVSVKFYFPTSVFALYLARAEIEEPLNELCLSKLSRITECLVLFRPITNQCYIHMKSSQLACNASQLTGPQMLETLAWFGLSFIFLIAFSTSSCSFFNWILFFLSLVFVVKIF